MDRGIHFEEVFEDMWAADLPIYNLVGTHEDRLTKLEYDLLYLT